MQTTKFSADADADANKGTLIPPYHGELNPLLASLEEAQEWQHRKDLAQVIISPREVGDLLMMGIGGFSPLNGFMGYEDWQGVCRDMQTADGMFWPIPITLATNKDKAQQLKIGEDVLLCEQTGNVLGVMKLEEKYPADKSFEAKNVFSTEDKEHPGIANLCQHGDIYLAGAVKVFTKGDLADKFPAVYLTPSETREQFVAKGWSKVTAFQTRNPMHRAHEHLVKIALEASDGVLIHSLLGNLKKGDVPAEIRIKAIDALIENYYVKDSVMNCGSIHWICVMLVRVKHYCMLCLDRIMAAHN